MEVAPINAEKARHTPEDGFVVDRVQATLLKPDGQRERIALRCFLQDSEENLEAAVSSLAEAKKEPKNKEVADGFSSNPKLFRTRWIVGVLAEPLQATRKTRIEISLKQTRDWLQACANSARETRFERRTGLDLSRPRIRFSDGHNRLTDLRDCRNSCRVRPSYVGGGTV